MRNSVPRRPNGSVTQLRGRSHVPKSLRHDGRREERVASAGAICGRRDAARLALRDGGVGGGPKTGRVSCSRKLGRTRRIWFVTCGKSGCTLVERGDPRFVLIFQERHEIRD